MNPATLLMIAGASLVVLSFGRRASASFPVFPVDDRPCRDGPCGPTSADKQRVSSPFGPRLFDGVQECHRGIDLPRETGTNVRAVWSGTVDAAGLAGSAGLRVRVRHPELGIDASYMHLSAISVERGAEVRPGDVLGQVGSTGRSTGPHLHFQIRDVATGRTVDPGPFIGLGPGEPC